MKDKKTKVAIISVVALLLVLIGVTYAYWLVTKTQTNSNIISSACLDITLDNETNDIRLSSQYPMSDEDGMKLTPYTFTVTNNCNTSVDYQVALEAIGDEATSIASSALKVALDNNAKVYSAYSEVATTINGAYESRSIGYARLSAAGNEGSSVTHSLRIWIDENAPISEANKTFASKISVTIGQGIDSPYATGTLAYDILINNGGAGVSVIDATEKADRISAVGNVSVGITGNYQYGTTYTYDATTNKYVLGGEIVQAKLSECRDGTKTCGKYTTKSTATSNATLYEITDFQTSGGYVTAYTKKYTTSFAGKAEESGLYKAQDDLGESYYFRGDVTNNYVQFGAYADDYKVYTVSSNQCYGNYCEYFSMEACEEAADRDYEYESEDTGCFESAGRYAGKRLYWRIVRINGDGTIRLVYDGPEKVLNGVKHEATIGTEIYNRNLNIGYTYLSNGTHEDSDAKKFIDNWYKTYLNTEYSSYIADGIFCNDRYGEVRYLDEDENITTEDEADHTNVYYGAYFRLAENKNPTLTCANKDDRYTKSSDIGNGLLTYPIGLLTADEAVFAGGLIYNSNPNYYLYSGKSYWTMSPHFYNEWINDIPPMWYIRSDGAVNGDDGDYYSIRPVINLRADVEFTGDGSFETPYVIVTE